jgi:FkbM family methyltransferase
MLVLCDRSLIYDVGLHRGEDSAYYLALGYRVVGFEANPELVSHCRERFACDIEEGRFILVDGAITAGSVGRVSFFRHPDSVFGTTSTAWATRNERLGVSQAIDVPAVDFAECLRQFGVPYFLKVDIEGADRLCFEALYTVSERPVYLSLESEKVDFDALVEEFDMLADLGYNRFAVVQQAAITRIDNATRIDRSHTPYTFERDTSGPFGQDIGPWLSRDEALARYRSIFRLYRLLGDHSWVRRTRTTRAILIRAGHLLHVPLPGWYDTHAMRTDDELATSYRRGRPVDE